MPNAANRIVRFRGGKLLRKGIMIEDELWIKGSSIIAPGSHSDEVIDASGLIIAPGYIDLQVNGAYGRDFSTDADALETIAPALLRHGVTSFLPTRVSSTPDDLPMKWESAGAFPLGLHLEGPFLHPDFAGAHHQLRPIQNPGAYRSLEHVKMITLAPELPNAHALIQFLKQKGIVVSAGHTSATYQQSQQAIQTGISAVTHLFNAMRPFHHREPGLIGAALTNPRLPYSLILDGIHLHPATVQMAWKTNPEGLFLVSDSMAALGLGDGLFQLGGRAVSVQKNVACLSGTTTLAGSVLGLDQAVRNLRSWTGCSIAQALEAASLKPARLLGLSHKGNLDSGSDADFLLLDQSLHVQATYLSGKLKFSK